MTDYTIDSTGITLAEVELDWGPVFEADLAGRTCPGRPPGREERTEMTTTMAEEIQRRMDSDPTFRERRRLLIQGQGAIREAVNTMDDDPRAALEKLASDLATVLL